MTEPRAVYSLGEFFRSALLVAFGMIGIAAVVIPISVTANHSVDSLGFLAFILAWYALVTWTGYWFLFRISYRLELVGESLTWHAPFRSGTVPAPAIRS